MRTNLLGESVLILLKQNVLYVIRVLGWLLRGKAYLKKSVAQRVKLDTEQLPYRIEVLSLIERFRKNDRRIFLASGSHKLIADAIAEHIGLFDGVIATNGTMNMIGNRKLKAIQSITNRFCYVGNSAKDVSIWNASLHAFFVAVPNSIRARVNIPHTVVSSLTRRPIYILSAVRPHQWIKNLLLFVPLVLANMIEPRPFLSTLLGFVSFLRIGFGRIRPQRPLRHRA